MVEPCKEIKLPQNTVNLTRAPRLAAQLTGASNLPERHVRVISVLEPPKPPLTTLLQLTRQLTTFTSATNPAVTRTPAGLTGAPLCGTTVEDSYTSTGDLKVKVTVSEV